MAGQCTGSFDQRDQRIVKKCLSAHLLAGSPVFVTFVPSPHTAGRAPVRSHSPASQTTAPTTVAHSYQSFHIDH